MEFQLKPTCSDGPFRVSFKNPTTSKKLCPGLSFRVLVEFAPKSLELVVEDVYIAIEGDKGLIIPLIAYLEQPILKSKSNA